MMGNAAERIAEDLEIAPGMGVTCSVGPDCYAFYVSSVLPGGIVGVYHAPARFDDAHPLEGGTQAVDAFEPGHKPDCLIKKAYGGWWECTAAGKRIRRWTFSGSVRFAWGVPAAYQDPSF